MKTNFKRLFALLLTVCMLASLMVPVAFAEDVAVAPSADVAETYPIRLKDLNHTDPLTATGLDALMVNTNAAGTTSYKAPGLTEAKLVNAYADGTLNWKFVATSNEAVYRNTDRAWQLRLNKGWAAFQIRVENSGMYALNLASDKNTYDAWTNTATAWAGDISAYIIPAAVANAAIANAVATETETAAVVGINGLLTDEYSVGTVAMAADQSDVTFGKTRMELGEYVVVINNPVATGLSIAELSLLGEAYELEEVASYALRPFDMTNSDPATYAGTINEQLASVTDGTATWATSLSVSKVLTSARYASLGVQYLTVSGSADMRDYNLMQLRLKNAGNWVALKLNIAESGEQYLTLTSDKRASIDGFTYTNNYAAWAGNVTAYLLPLSALTATDATTVGAAMTAENCIGTKTMLADDTSITFDKKYLEVGDYVLIYTADEGGYSVCEASLSKVAGQELPESDKITGTVATYNFELYDTERYANIFMGSGRGPTNKANGSMEGVYEAGEIVGDILDREYANGDLNWNIAAYNNVDISIRGANNDGMRIQKPKVSVPEGETAVPDSGWVAFAVNVPVGGLYSVGLVSEYSANYASNIYILPADADIAASLTEENKVGAIAGQTGLGFTAAFSAGENLIVFELAETTAKASLYLSSITLSVLSDAVTYNFALPQNEAFMNAWYAANDGAVTAMPASATNLKSWAGTTAEFVPYEAIASLFASGEMNWALGASSGNNLDGADDTKNFRPYEDSLRCQLENADSTLNYTSFHLKVDQAGTFNITVNYYKTSDAVKTYLFKSPVAYDGYSDRLDADGKTDDVKLTTYMTEENLVCTPAAYNVPEVNFTYTFEEAGEYVIAFAPLRADKPTAMYLYSIVMEPVSFNYVADGKGYATFDEAAANATESIILMQNAQVGNLVINPGVTLDLNGYVLYASSVDATAPGAQIIDALDGKGLIRGDIEFNEANAQLPLYDIDADGYKLFNVDVVSSATTGSGSSTKYWFKVNFSNSAVFDLIGTNTELRIVANMTYVKSATDEAFDVVASADAAFTNTWAAKNTSYIVVTTTGEASGTGSSFELIPGVTANGVVISGDAMHKA